MRFKRLFRDCSEKTNVVLITATYVLNRIRFLKSLIDSMPPCYKCVFTSFQASEFFMFGALMVVDMIIFAFMAYHYKYANHSHNNEEQKEKELALELMDRKYDESEKGK